MLALDSTPLDLSKLCGPCASAAADALSGAVAVRVVVVAACSTSFQDNSGEPNGETVIADVVVAVDPQEGVVR